MKFYAISDLHLSGEEVKKPMDIFGSYVKGYVEEYTGGLFSLFHNCYNAIA